MKNNLNKSINNRTRFKGLKIFLKGIEIIIVLICIFLAGIIVTQRISKNEKSFLGYRIYKVETGSMIPVYKIGDVILMREKEFDTIQVGDDVSYKATSGVMKGNVITHRVIEITEDKDGEKVIVTKGVANNTADGIIYSSQVNGVVISKLHILSLICRGMNNLYIFYFCIIVPITIYIFFNLLKANRKSWEKEERKN